MNHIIWSTGHELLLKDIVSANNCELNDSKGNKYIDLESGVWCTSVGHSNLRITKVIHSQIDKIIHTGFNYSNPIIEEASKKILEITNLTKGKCEFLCSGSEAVEFCVRAAKAIKDTAMLLTFSDSYFGAYGEASKKDSKEWYRYNWQQCSCNSDGKGCMAECPEFSKIPFDQIGIFLFEPGSSSGLVRFPSEKLIESISDKVKGNNGLIIINEVTTGIGRTGKWFGVQHYNLNPDMIAIGKGIGNGYPVSVATFSERASNLLEKKQFHYSQSHQNDPLGASIAKEVINTITEGDLIKRSERLGIKIINSLNEIKKTNLIIREIRGRGLMIVIELIQEAKKIQKELLKRGYIVAKRSGHEVLRMDPALTIDEKDVDSFIDNFNKIINNENMKL
ncbi:MAG: aminotransferase class III-fold pyridoxal phosphate-dependent enzyme [Bacteroidetes bacterium]|nr:MAG: aminotransferase class III-fold pyridoxal phosphate-dependent enzyme [Bacteroidota bacterium]